MTDESQQAFLKELTILSRKYSIGIAGCGCCGSPFLTDIGKSAETKEYTVKGKDDLSFE